MTISKWISSCFIGVCVIEICNSGLFVTSEIHGLKDFDPQDQQAFSPDVVLKSSPLRVNRGSGEANREPPSLLTRKAPHQQKSALTSTKLLSTNQPPAEELNHENGMSLDEQDEKLPAYGNDEEEASPTFSSTEMPKKKVMGSLRPFRSQQDLVESLKRRRQMIQQQGYTSSSTTSPSGTTSERTQSKRKYGNTNKSPSYYSSPNIVEKKPTSFNRRHGTQSTPLIVEEVMTEESDNVISQPVARNGRTNPNARRTRY